MEDKRTNDPIPPQGFKGERPKETAEPASAKAVDTGASASQAKKAGKAKDAKGARSGSGLGKTFAAGFAGALVACAIAFFVMGIGSSDGVGSTVIGGSGSTIGIAEDADRAEAVAQKALPSIAAIDVYSAGGSRSLFGSSSDSLVYTGLGSGVVISDDGYILTNSHVVEGASALQVAVDGQEYEAKLVGSDPSTDLAVVKVDAKGLTAIDLGDSDRLVPGQWVMALGSPFGFEQSVSTGIVSATSRTVTVPSADGQSAASVYSQMIQTDAAINPGNSGGALVDAEGRLIGINAVIESASGGSAGVGFAIPANYAINIAQQIIDGDDPTHAQLGVSCNTMSPQLAERIGSSVSVGAYVSGIYPGSSAEEAGIEEGDIITKIGDDAIETSTDVVAAVRSRQVGEKVDIEIMRGDKQEVVSVTLGSDGAE